MPGKKIRLLKFFKGSHNFDSFITVSTRSFSLKSLATVTAKLQESQNCVPVISLMMQPSAYDIIGLEGRWGTDLGPINPRRGQGLIRRRKTDGSLPTRRKTCHVFKARSCVEERLTVQRHKADQTKRRKERERKIQRHTRGDEPLKRTALING